MQIVEPDQQQRARNSLPSVADLDEAYLDPLLPDGTRWELVVSSGSAEVGEIVPPAAQTLAIAAATPAARAFLEQILMPRGGGLPLGFVADLRSVESNELFVARLVAEWVAGSAWAVSVPTGELLPSLDEVDTSRSETVLEPFIGGVQRLLDDPHVELDKFDEDFIRSQLNAIRGWHRSGAAIPAQVTAAIGLIVERLQATGHTQADVDAIRRRLDELEPEPESITGEIVEQFELAIEQIASLGSFADLADLMLPGEALTAALGSIREADLRVESNTKLRNLMKEEAAKSIGAEAGPLLRWLTKAGASTAVGAPILIQLFRRLDELLKIYTGF